jgi:hypothetical protein
MLLAYSALIQRSKNRPGGIYLQSLQLHLGDLIVVGQTMHEQLDDLRTFHTF